MPRDATARAEVVREGGGRKQVVVHCASTVVVVSDILLANDLGGGSLCLCERWAWRDASLPRAWRSLLRQAYEPGSSSLS